jgi:tryptophan 2,3-dioxygenase
MEQEENNETREGYYATYLEIDKLLSIQVPLTQTGDTVSAHDEMLFIITHQTYELWFKQILYEINSCIKVLIKNYINDEGPQLNIVVHRLKRIVEIWKLLNHQVDVLETMTPLDFLDFRPRFDGASGFQSRQFREIEARLGLRMEQRYKGEYYKHTQIGGFNENDYHRITDIERDPTVLNSINQWLERMPFFALVFWQTPEHSYQDSDESNPADHPFWKHYRDCYGESLSPRDDRDKRMQDFDEVLFNKGQGAFTARALRSALFIMLYRDEPLFRLPFQLLNTLQEIDEQVGNFRYRHFQMVRRMIGLRVGTGGTSGATYLEGAVHQNYIYKELSSIVTYLIERRNIPPLPERLRRLLILGI